MVNANLIKTVKQYFAEHKSQSFVVSPSIPILYFGDEVAYRKSKLKVITVGKNPSWNEFFDPSNRLFYIKYRFPNWDGSNLTHVLNEYFIQKPLKQWFSSFEPILNGLKCSYYPNIQFQNIALHTDICSPIATQPTWSKLNLSQQQLLFKQGVEIWWNLIEDLEPDLILVSIPRYLFLQNISNVLGDPIHIISHKGNSLIRKSPYIVFRQYLNINNKSTKIVFGQAANKPFGTINNSEKLIMGTKI